MNLKRMKNKTYHNVLAVAKILQQEKGYEEQESYEIAKNLFDSMISDNQAGFNVGWTMDRRVAQIATKEEYDAEFSN